MMGDCCGTAAEDISVSAAGREWHLRRDSTLEELWEGIAEDPARIRDDRLPYWTELWPSSLVLGDFLASQKGVLQGRLCLDIGCGLGLTAMIGEWLGAKVLAMDHEADALRHAIANAAANGVPRPVPLLADWRQPAIRPGAADVCWGADILYERRFVEPVLKFLEHVLPASGTAWIADPGRPFCAGLMDTLRDRGRSADVVLTRKCAALSPPMAKVTVNVWEVGPLRSAAR